MIKLIDRIPVCPHGTKDNLDKDLILSLERLERELERKLRYNSGYRCEACNAAAGGVKNSAHVRGKAVDIIVADSMQRFVIVRAVLQFSFVRVGIGKNFVHVDVDTSLPQFVLWLY